MRGWVSKLHGLVTVLAAVGFVALAGVGGWLYWNRVQLRGEQAARAELAPLAANQIPKVFAYDYQTVERSLTDAYTLLTPEYRQEFEDRPPTTSFRRPGSGRWSARPTWSAWEYLTAQRDSASVMVFMNRTVTDKSRQPVYDGSRLRVDYQKIDGKWLIRYITPMYRRRRRLSRCRVCVPARRSVCLGELLERISAVNDGDELAGLDEILDTSRRPACRRT